ncbi:MAG: LysM domain-containing protein [Clostridiaceae bacterium]|nr:LysM domain-containing protein [Clostridiaceae bacterium]DAM37344.1 MAG TPA: tail protein [Caudoviricetes sp.]
MSQQTVGYIDKIAQAGDTFDSLALAAYNEETMATYIMRANPDLVDLLVFEGGENVKIPILEAVETPDTLPPWRR